MLRRMMKYVVQKENVDVLKPQCSNKIIRNVLCSVYFPAANFFWSPLFGKNYCDKAVKMQNKFCIDN